MRRLLTRGALAAISIAAACSLASPSPASAFEPRVPEGFFGVSSPELMGMAVAGQEAALARHATAIDGAGLDFVRLSVPWRQVEPLVGVGGLHVYNWTAVDRVATALAGRGLAMLPSPYGAPVWAADPLALLNGCGNRAAVLPVHAASFGAFAEAIVRRYGRGGAFWSQHPELTPAPVDQVEIWNEPNWTGFWCPYPDPEAFASLARAAAVGVRAADPEVTVALGGMVLVKNDQTFSDGGIQGMEPGAFISRMIQREPSLASLLDAVAIHLYEPDADSNISLLGWFRSRLEAVGLGDAELMVTEFGWKSAGAAVDGVPEAVRAQSYRELLDQLPRTDCGVIGIAAHSWASAETLPNNPDHWFGIADIDTSELYESGAAYRDMVALFEGRGPTPAPREVIGVCGQPPPDQDSDGTPDEDDDYPTDPDRDEGANEPPPPGEEPPPPRIHPPRVPDDFFGVTNSYLPADSVSRRLHYDSMEAVGLREVREQLEWWDIESSSTDDDPNRYRWSDTDRRLLSYARRGIQTTLTTTRKPVWVGSNPTAATDAYATFMGRLAQRYQPDGTFWSENRHLDPSLAPRDYEVWFAGNDNEGAWDGSASAAEYAATYASVQETLREVDPQGRAVASLYDVGDGGSAEGFIRAMVAARPQLAGNLDAVYVVASGARSSAALEQLAGRVRVALAATGNDDTLLYLGFGAPTQGTGSIAEADRAAFFSDVASRLPRLDCRVDGIRAFAWAGTEDDSANPWAWYGIAGLGDASPSQTAIAYGQVLREFQGYGPGAAPREALHRCMSAAPDRDGDGVADAAESDPLDPTQSTAEEAVPMTPDLDGGPPEFTNVRNATFTYAAVGATSYWCQFDGEAVGVCDPAGRSVFQLTEGEHRFTVRGVSPLGLVGPVIEHEWTVDTKSPQTMVLSGPDGQIESDSATFSFDSDEEGVGFVCRLDLGSWENCQATTRWDGLSNGPHTIRVVAVDRAGNGDPTPEVRQFEVLDATPAMPLIESGPAPASVSTLATGLPRSGPRPQFTFSAERAASFECRFDTASFAGCSGAKSHSAGVALSDGSHTFEVRGVSAGGRRGPIASLEFEVDAHAPKLSITQAPKRRTRDRTPTVAFEARDNSSHVAYCRVDGSSWRRCRSPFTTRRLRPGRHAVGVRAVDQWGTAVAREVRFRVVKRKR